MNEILSQSIFFGIAITLVTYEIGLWIKQKTGKAIANPLLISVILIVAVILIWFLGTRLGLSIRATGDNAFMVRCAIYQYFPDSGNGQPGSASVSSAGAVKDLSQGHFRRNHRRRADCHGERFCFKPDVRSES